MLNTGFYLILRVAARVVPLLPLRLLYGAASILGSAAYLLLPRVRGNLLQNLRHALPDRNPRERRRIARAAFRHDARNWADTLRIPRLSSGYIEASVKVDGWDHLESAAAQGRGVVIVSMHLGNFDLVGQLLAARGWSLTVPVERMEPAPLFEFLREQRASHGITIVPLEQAARAMIRALAHGGLVGLTADRVIAGKTVKVRFFGRDAELPRGFASLVRHVEAPVLVGVGVRKNDLTFQGLISKPIAVSRTGSAVDEIINTQRVVNEMEQLIRRFPEQWMAFWPIWEPTGALPEAATMEQQKRAAV